MSGKRVAGFTLIEIVVIMILIGILSATALPRLMTNDYESAFFKDEVVNAMRYAKRAAVASQDNVEIHFFTPTGGATRENPEYLTFQRKDASGTLTPLPSPYAEDAGSAFRVIVPRDVVVAGAFDGVYFDSAGQCRATATDLIQDFRMTSNDFEITLECETGFIDASYITS